MSRQATSAFEAPKPRRTPLAAQAPLYGVARRAISARFPAILLAIAVASLAALLIASPALALPPGGGEGGDFTPPQTTITDGPTGETSNSTPSFSFNSSEAGSTFECQIDGGAAFICSSPHTTPTLATGPHSFSVAAIDAAGNMDATPATRDFSVAAPPAEDTTPPAVSLIKPNDPATEFWIYKYKRATVPLEATASDDVAVNKVEFYVRGEKVGEDTSAPYEVPFDTTTKGDGDAEIYARAVDTAGNATDSARRTVVLDNTAPDVAVTSAPAGPVRPDNVRFNVTAHDANWLYGNMVCWKDALAPTYPGNHEFCIGGGVDKTFTGSYWPSGLSEGEHTIYFRASDAASNFRTISKQVTVDATAPDTAIASGPSGTMRSTTASFGFTSSEPGGSFECRLDGASAWSDCSSPKSYSSLSEGTHTFEVRALDAAGNVDETPATRSWKVDSVAPNTSIASGPSGTVRSTSASFGFSSSEPGSRFECRLDATTAWSPCTSPKALGNLSQGTHTFRVRAIDEAGNPDATPATRTWKVDTVAPKVTALSPSSGAKGVSTAANVLATFSEPLKASTVTKTTVKLVRKGTTTPVAAKVTYDASRKRATLNPNSGLRRGATYTATVTRAAKDLAGNPLQLVKAWSFTVRR